MGFEADIRGIGYNYNGRRGLTPKDKARVKRKARKPKSYEVDHKKPVGMYRSGNPYDFTEDRIDVRDKNGRLPKRSYDRDRNLQAKSPKRHKIKSRSDNIKIRAKRRKNNPYSAFGNF